MDSVTQESFNLSKSAFCFKDAISLEMRCARFSNLFADDKVLGARFKVFDNLKVFSIGIIIKGKTEIFSLNRLSGHKLIIEQVEQVEQRASRWVILGHLLSL